MLLEFLKIFRINFIIVLRSQFDRIIISSLKYTNLLLNRDIEFLKSKTDLWFEQSCTKKYSLRICVYMCR